MSVILYPYQDQFARDIYAKIREGHKRIACVMSTGGGKSNCAAKIIKDARSKGRRVMFLVTIDCLVDQTEKTFINNGILDYGIIAGGRDENPDAPVQIVSLQTLVRRLHWLEKIWDLFIFDEAHTSAWYGVAADYIFSIKEAIILGLTASPFRLSKKQGFGDKFTAAVLAPPMMEITKMGFLSPLRYLGLNAPDLTDVETLAGDFEGDSLSRVCNTIEAIDSAIDGWEYHCKGLRTIAFAVDVDHANNIADRFRLRGWPAESVTGETPRKVREKLFEALGAGEIKIISSCNALSTGFDEPNIGCGLLMRPTKSPALHMQQIGRVARIAPGKTEGIILDAAGNVERPGLGFPEAISAAMTEDSILGRGAEGEGEAPVKHCPGTMPDDSACMTLLHLSVMECPTCGYIFPPTEKEKPEAIGTFESLMNPAYVREGGEDEHKAYYRHLVLKNWRAGNNSPSGAYVDYIKEGFPKFPKPGGRWARGVIFGDSPTYADVVIYQRRVKGWAKDLGKDERWEVWLMNQEFGSTWKAILAGAIAI